VELGDVVGQEVEKLWNERLRASGVGGCKDLV
jgi:hypothetical protein